MDLNYIQKTPKKDRSLDNSPRNPLTKNDRPAGRVKLLGYKNNIDSVIKVSSVDLGSRMLNLKSELSFEGGHTSTHNLGNNVVQKTARLRLYTVLYI